MKCELIEEFEKRFEEEFGAKEDRNEDESRGMERLRIERGEG